MSTASHFSLSPAPWGRFYFHAHCTGGVMSKQLALPEHTGAGVRPPTKLRLGTLQPLDATAGSATWPTWDR